MTYVAFVVREDGELGSVQKRSLDQTEELAALWEVARQKKGHLYENSPFRCVVCREALYWRQPASRDAHFYLVPSSKCSLRKAGSKQQHLRIQSALLRIGQNLGEHSAGVEYPAKDDQGRPRFFDVVWPSRKIAWEVDLTINPKSEQQFRQKLRAKRNEFRMISLVCSKKLQKRRIQDRSIPTVVIRELSTDVESPGNVKLEESVVYGVMRLRKNGEKLGFKIQRNYNFIDFINSMDGYLYGHYTGIEGGKRWGWARETDLEKIKEFSVIHDEIAKNEYEYLKSCNALGELNKLKNNIACEQQQLQDLKIIVSQLRSFKPAEIRANLSRLFQRSMSERENSIIEPVVVQANKIAVSSAILLYINPFKRKSLQRGLVEKIMECENLLQPEYREKTDELIVLENNIKENKEDIDRKARKKAMVLLRRDRILAMFS